MANNSVVTQEVLQNALENYHENFVYPYLNGATHAGCVPVGSRLDGWFPTTPKYYLYCDGAEYLKSDYPELAELLAQVDEINSTTQYVGSDANHFKVPDVRGEFIRGTGTNSHENQGNGANVGVHQNATEIPAIGTYNWSSSEVTITAQLPSNEPNVSNGMRNFDSKVTNPWYYADSARMTLKSASGVTNPRGTVRPTNTSLPQYICYKTHYIDLALDSFPIDISNPTDGQLLMYDATAGRWVNGGHKYSTDEHIVGTWIDGKPLYEATIISDPITITSNARTWTTINDTFAVNHNIKDCISISAFGFKNTEFIKIPQTDYVWNGQEMAGNGILDIFWSSHLTNKPFRLLTHNGVWVSGMIVTFTIHYTKTTD